MTTNTITALLVTVAATNWFAVQDTQLEVGVVSQQSWLEVGTNRFLLSSNVVMESAPLRVRTNEPSGILYMTNSPSRGWEGWRYEPEIWTPRYWTNPVPHWMTPTNCTNTYDHLGVWLNLNGPLAQDIFRTNELVAFDRIAKWLEWVLDPKNCITNWWTEDK